MMLTVGRMCDRFSTYPDSLHTILEGLSLGHRQDRL
jgi:hypothetical protein